MIFFLFNFINSLTSWQEEDVLTHVNQGEQRCITNPVNKGQLPDHPNHPKGRNSYAHVAICIRSKFKKSYKEIEDEKLQEVIEYIEHLKNNPS